jgi:hypothetical protein
LHHIDRLGSAAHVNNIRLDRYDWETIHSDWRM